MSHSDYILEGEKIPSVTETLGIVAKNWLYSYDPEKPEYEWGWYPREVKKHGWQGWLNCRNKFQEGCNFGTEAHQALEWKDFEHPVVKLVYEKFMPQVQDMVQQEVKLVSEKYKYHGTADFICRLEGDPGLFVGDWKTSNSDSIWYIVQMAAYANAWNETHPDQKIDQAICVHYNKKLKIPKLKITRFYGLKKYFKAFLACKEVLNYDRQTGPWRKENVKLGTKISKNGIQCDSSQTKEQGTIN